MKKSLIVSFINLFFLVGCVTQYPSDISLVSVNAVDYRQEPMLPAPPVKGSFSMIDPYRDFLQNLSDKRHYQLIRDVDLQAYFENESTLNILKDAKNEKEKLLLKVQFKSKENLSEYQNKKSYSISSVPYFCDKPKAQFQLVYPYVYSKRFNVSYPLNFDLERDSDGYINYHVFLYTQDKSYGYDLTTKPKDLCIQLKGGNHTGFGFESNILIIPSSVISVAIKK